MAEVLTDAAMAEVEEKTKFLDDRLLSAMAARPDGSIAQWAQDCGWMHTPKSDEAKPGEEPQPKPYKTMVVRILKRLEENGYVKKIGKNHSLTPAGRKAVPPTSKTSPEAVPDKEEESASHKPEFQFRLPSSDLQVTGQGNRIDDWPPDYRAKFEAAYPHKTGMKPALDALDKARGSVSWRVVLQAIAAYSDNRSRTN
jgi:hypothetical protein